MAIMNLALLALVPFVLARPQVGHGDAHKALHVRDTTGTGLSGPFSHTAGASGSAPFPVPGGNSTAAAGSASTGLVASSTSSSGPVYVTSVINVVPQPIEKYVTGTAQGATGQGTAGSPASPSAGAEGPGGSEGSGAGAGTGDCGGPSTVTITNANTVTVTVTPAASSAAAAGANTNGGAGASLPTIPSSAYIPPSQSAPFPIGNSSVAAGGSGTGTAPAPVSTSVAAVEVTSTPPAAPVAHSTPPSAPVAPIAQPYHAPEEKVKAAANSAPYVAPAESSAPASAPSASSAPVSGGGDTTGPKGVAFNTLEQLESVEGIAWACNWGQENIDTDLKFDYVPQLWGPKNDFQQTIKASCSGKEHCLFYNEPDMPLSEGGCQVDVGQTISDFYTYMGPVRKAGSKVSTPCVANSNADYMEEFLGKVGAGNVDIMCFHWYGTEVSDLLGYVKTFTDMAHKYDIPEVWINEWAINPGGPSDLAPFAAALDKAVTRYAYNMNNMPGFTGY